MDSRQDIARADLLSQYISNAKYYIYNNNLNNARHNFQLALDAHNNISDKNADHNRSFSRRCNQLATASFNKSKYEEAIFYYEQGIQQLVNIEHLNDNLVDADFRKLVHFFINLRDAFMHLLNKDAAVTAFENAIKAFNFIKVKTTSELPLVYANDNYVSFLNHYENILSKPSYLVSREFKNNDQIMHNAYDECVMEKSLSNLSVSEKKSNDDELEDLIKHMDLSTPALFIELPNAHTLNDDKYRTTAKEFVHIANQFYSQQLVTDALKTIEQALHAFNQIKQKSFNDQTEINALQQQLAQLRAPKTYTHGMFGSSWHNRNDYNNNPSTTYNYRF